MQTPTQIIDLAVSADGSETLKQAVYEFESEAEMNAFAADIAENGYIYPEDTEQRPLTPYEVYKLKQLVKFILLVCFGWPTP